MKREVLWILEVFLLSRFVTLSARLNFAFRKPFNFIILVHD